MPASGILTGTAKALTAQLLPLPGPTSLPPAPQVAVLVLCVCNESPPNLAS